MSRRNIWHHRETLALFQIMKKQNSVKNLSSKHYKKDEIFLLIEKEMFNRGFKAKCARQIEYRWKNLKKNYSAAKKNTQNCESFSYFDDVDQLLGYQPLTTDKLDIIKNLMDETETNPIEQYESTPINALKTKSSPSITPRKKVRSALEDNPVKSVKIVELFLNRCRTCGALKDDTELVNVSTVNRRRKIVEMLTDLCPELNCSPKDLLPKGICYPCLQYLSDADAFREKCIKTQQFFEMILETQDKSANVVADSPINYEFIDCENVKNDNENVKKVKRQQNFERVINDSPVPPDHIDLMSVENEEIVKNENEIEEDDLSYIFCDRCPFLCTNMEELELHMDTHNIQIVDKENACENCGEQFNGKVALAHHLRQAHPENSTITFAELSDDTFQCNNCSQVLTSVEDLELHCCDNEQFSEFSTSKPPSPDEIEENDSNSLAEKVRKKPIFRSFKCAVCFNTFRTKTSLTNHMRIHSGEKPFKCDICGRSFGQQTILREHRITHTGERRHFCHICGKGFNVPARLKIHILTHTDTIPYKCNQCSAEFKYKCHLEEHILRRHREKQYSCIECSKQFALKYDLNKHMYTHNGYPYICSLCNKRFLERRLIRHHFRTVHNQTIDASVIQKFIPVKVQNDELDNLEM